MKLSQSAIIARDSIVWNLRAKAQALESAVAIFNEEKNEAFDKLGEAVVDYNNEVAEAFASVSVALDKYNEAREQALNFVQDVIADLHADFGDKSEKWQESERGVAAQDLISDLEEIDLSVIEVLPHPDDLDVDWPDDVEPYPNCEHADNLESLPTEVSQG